MGDFVTSVIVNLIGNFERQSRAYTKANETFTKNSRRNLKSLNNSYVEHSKIATGIGRKLGLLATGVIGVQAIQNVMSIEERYGRLGIQANKSEAEMQKLKETIFETAKLPEFRVNPDQVLSAVAEIVEKTGDLEFAENNLRNIAAAIQATGAAGESIGGIMAEFQKMGIKEPKAVLESIDILNVQGKEGAFTLQNLAALGPRVVTAYTSMGRTGVPALREMGAALQVIRQGTGSSEMAATAFEALIRTLSDADKIKMLEGAGITVFEDKEAGKLRAINELMTDIIQKSKGNKVILSKVFDAEALRAFNAAAGEYKRGGKLESLDKFYNVQADGTVTLMDAERAAKLGNSAFQNVKTRATEVSDTLFNRTIKELSADLDAYESAKGFGGFMKATGEMLVRPFKDEKDWSSRQSEKLSGEIKITIDQDNRAKVKKVTSNNKDVTISADNGLQAGGP